MSSYWRDLGVYTCEKCSLKTQDETVFRHHPCKSKTSAEAVIQYDSKTGMFSCSLCKIQLNDREAIEHLQFHLLEKPYKCSLCGVEFLTYTEVSGHCKQYHAQENGKISLKCASYTKNLLNEAKQNGHASFKPKNHNVNLADRGMHIENVSSNPPSRVPYQPVMSSVSPQNQDKNTVQSHAAVPPIPLPPSSSEVLTSSHSFHRWKMVNSAPVYSLQGAHPVTNLQRSNLHQPAHLTQSVGLFLPEKSMCMTNRFQGSTMSLMGTNCLQETFNSFNANQVGISNPPPKSSSLRDDSTGMRLPISVNNNSSPQHKKKTLYSQSFSNNAQKKTDDSVAASEQSSRKESVARTPDSSLRFLQTEAVNEVHQSTDSIAQKPDTKSSGAKSKSNSSFLILVRNFFLCLNCKMKWKAANKTLFLEHVWKEHAHPDRDFSCCSRDKFSTNCSRLQTLMASQFKSNYMDTNAEAWQKSTNNMESTNASSEISERNLPLVNIQSPESQTGVSVTSSLMNSHYAEVHDSGTFSEIQIEEEDISSASDQLIIDLTVLNTSENSEACPPVVTGSAQNEVHEKELSQELETSALPKNFKVHKEADGQINSCGPEIQVSYALGVQSICTEDIDDKDTSLSKNGELVKSGDFAGGSQNNNPDVKLDACSNLEISSDVKKQSYTVSNSFVQVSKEQSQYMSDSKAENTYAHDVTECISDNEGAPELNKNSTLLSDEIVETTNSSESGHKTVPLNSQNTPQNSEDPLCKSGHMSLRQSSEKNGNVGENVDKVFYKCGCHACTFSTHKPQDFLVHLRDLHKMAASFPCIHCGHEETHCKKLIEHMDSHVGDASDRPVTSVSVLSGQGKIETVSGHNFEMAVRKLEQLSVNIKTDIKYSCNECDTHFITLEELREHLSQSMLKIVGCGYCDSKFLDSVMCNCHIVQEHAEKTVYRRVNRKLLCKDRKDNSWVKKSRDSSISKPLKRNSLTEDPSGVAQDIQNKKPETECSAKNVGSIKNDHIVNLSDLQNEANSSSTMLSKTILKPSDPQRNADSIQVVIQNCISKSSPGDIDHTVKLACGSTEFPTKDVHISEHYSAETPAVADSVNGKSCSNSDSERETVQDIAAIGSCVSRSAVEETVAVTCLDHFCTLDPSVPADEAENELKSDLPRLFDLCGSKKLNEYLAPLYFLDKNQYCCGECNKTFTHLKHLHCHIFLCQGKLGVVFCYLCNNQFEHPDTFKNHFQKEHTSLARKVLYSEVNEEVLEKLKTNMLSPDVFANLCKELRTTQNLCPEVLNSSCNLELDMPNLTADTGGLVEPQGPSDSSVLIGETNSSDVVVDKAGLAAEVERQPPSLPKETCLFSFTGVKKLELSDEHEVQDKSQSADSHDIPSKKPKLTENCDEKIYMHDEPTDQRMDTRNGIGSLDCEVERSPSLQNSLTEKGKNKDNHHSKTKKDDFADDKEGRLFKCSVCELKSYSYTNVKKHVKNTEYCQFAKVKTVHSESGKRLIMTDPESKEKAAKHEEQKKEECNYKCHICNLIVPWNPTEMQKHIDNQHPFYCACGHCGSIYYMQSKLINHSRFVHRDKETKIQKMNYSAVFSPVNLHPTENEPLITSCPQSGKMDKLNVVASESAKNRSVLVNSKPDDKMRIKPEQNVSKNSDTFVESTKKEVSQSSFSSSHKITPAIDGSKQKTNVLSNVVQEHRLFKTAQMASKSSIGEEAAAFHRDSECKEGLYESEAAQKVEKENSPLMETLIANIVNDIRSISVMTNCHKDTTAETPALKGKDNFVSTTSLSRVQEFCQSEKLSKSASAIKPCAQTEVSKGAPGKADFPFGCTQCQACATSIFYLKCHFKKKHIGEVVSFIDRRSESIFNSAGMQLGGKSGSTPSERHLCGYCPFRSEFRTNVLKHSWTIHNKKSCVSLRRHPHHPDRRLMKQTKGPSEPHISVTCYRCHLCGETVSTEFMFRLHLAKHGGFTQTTKLPSSRGILICPCCGYIAASSMDYASHLESHQSERRFACSLCGQDDHFKQGLQKHIKTVHNNDPNAQVLDRKKLAKMVNVRPSLVNLDAKVRLVDPFIQNEDYLWKLLLDNKIKMIDVVVEDCENILAYRNHDFFDIKVL